MPLGSPVVPPTSRNNAPQVTPESPRGGENNKPVAVLYPFGDVRSWGAQAEVVRDCAEVRFWHG
jgi:hypothetical protein